MKTAQQARIETQNYQRRIPQGAQLAVEYKVERRIEAAIKEGKYEITITVESEDCFPLVEFLRSRGYSVSWYEARCEGSRSISINWKPNLVDDWDGP